MRIRYSDRFLAAFRALGPKDKQSVIQTLEWFVEHPGAGGLRDHALTGRMRGMRSLSVDGDLRIIYAARNDFQDITLLDVGGHRDVYRR